MLNENEIISAINAFAAALSSQPLGLAYHQPEQWAEHTKCFENVLKKVQISGGGIRFGWIFGHRLPSHIINSPGYLMATHHAVWHSPNGNLIDVTPLHPDPKHHPFRPGGHVLFQVDDKAEPIQLERYLAPLPLVFFPLNNEEPLYSYVQGLNREEDAECKALYQKLREEVE